MNNASGQDVKVADAASGNWVDRFVPDTLRPYARLARLDRPIGWWLLLIPCWWGQALAELGQGGSGPNLWYAFLFLIGAIVMRGAGCTLNDIADRDFDAKVARTRSRPIPSGQVSVKAAIAFLVLQALIGFLILLQFNGFTIWLGIASLLLVAIYPFMKRFTYWPQFFLGLAFNWGCLVGWAAITGALSLAPLLLYAGGIAWTLAYDTIYALQDIEDDALIGVKSTALKFGASSPTWIGGFFVAALVLIDLAVWQAHGGFISHIGVAAAAAHGLWQMLRLDINNPQRCRALFLSNKYFGLLILAGFVIDGLTG
jgi:4-hydroxybenzoate polyprenyltransferase